MIKFFLAFVGMLLAIGVAFAIYKVITETKDWNNRYGK